MKEVLYHLGQYIKARHLYDEKQQHIVHCSNDPLGELFGVENFSIKEPRRLFAMISRNLVTADSEGCCLKEASSFSQTESSKQDQETLSIPDDSDWLDADSDQFSVEFEVDSEDSDDYSPIGDEEGLTDEDFNDEDYWKCPQYDEMNPPIPRCLPDQTEEENCPIKRKIMEESLKDGDIDDPDGKKQKLTEALDSANTKIEDEEIDKSETKETENFSQPSTSNITSDSQEEYGEDELDQAENSEESLPLSSVEPCVICQTRPKSGCIVHGRTGHLMACFTCAKKLKKRNKPCPVCRQPIQMVVMTSFS
ncbi:E3 ubiquitin-protein ligase Mdm2-like isoform X2 [Dendrobates tinctorius]